MPISVLVDTCVWLELAKDHREQPVISALEDLVKHHGVELIIPETVIDEFVRNKDRVIAEAKRGLQAHFRMVRDAVRRHADEERAEETLSALNEIDHRVAMRAEGAVELVKRVEALLEAGTKVPLSDRIKVRAADRAFARSAPFHRAKNSIGDAALIETYAELLGAAGDRQFAFVTLNSQDFSHPQGDRRTPHPDIAHLFDGDRSRFVTSLMELIRSIDEELLEEHHYEFGFAMQSRTLTEILEAENLLFRQVWYNRHWSLRARIERGEVKVVPTSEYSTSPYRDDQILDTIWAGALASAKRTAEEVGEKNLGP